MAQDPENKNETVGSGTNPQTSSRRGGINPSAPTSGTEAWGTTSGERKTAGGNNAAETQAGQLKGNPGDQQTEAVLRDGGGASSTSNSANRNQNSSQSSMERDQSRLGDDQAERSTSRTTTFAMNTSHGGADRTFRCADVGNTDCRFETGGLEDDEIIIEVYKHGKESHGWGDWTEALRTKVRDAIRYRNAA